MAALLDLVIQVAHLAAEVVQVELTCQDLVASVELTVRRPDQDRTQVVVVVVEAQA
jgi:hypothetical protein